MNQNESPAFGQMVFGDYVLTPCRNAFNGNTSWWMSKDGYTMAVYCFSAKNESEVKLQTSPEVIEGYKRLFDNHVGSRQRPLAEYRSQKGAV